MKIITVDMETYYSREFSLTKLTTEEYVRSPDFEVIGVSVQVGSDEPVWFSGTRKETKEFLESFDFGSNLALAHNAMFDAAILSWHFDIHPKGWLDTLSMARALHGTEVGGSLAVLAKHYELGVKGDEVLNALGKRRADFTPTELARYGEYCKNDVALTWSLFTAMSEKFPKIELRLIDITIRMFSEPVLQLDNKMLINHLRQVQEGKEALMSVLVVKGVTSDYLMSNPKFAVLLQAYGVEPPMKISPTTGKETYAFSKTDEEFKALLEHENPDVQALVAARLGTKSTLEETRTQRFIGISERGPMPVPLRYYAAHTGRWGGDDKLNLQNLPRGGLLKYAIVTPAGYVMIDSDSSQIEARTLAWLAGQNDLVEAFERGEDVYKLMAAAIYGKAISTITKDERFVGKQTVLGCIAEGTLVLSDSGWKPIEAITLQDKLWDGEGWVCHQGLVTKGYKQTLSVCGSWLTPDHQILCGTQWKEAQYVVADESILSLALGTGAASSPSRGMLKAREGASPHLSCGATVAHQSTPSITTTLKTSGAHAAIHALKQQAQVHASCIGATVKFWRTIPTGKDCLIGLRALFQGATQKLVRYIRTTVVEASPYTSLGAQTGGSSLNISSHLSIGATTPATLTGLITTKDMNRATSGLQQKAKTPETSEKSKFCSRNLMTYDIAYAGPNNRFMIATDAGPLIVHNCGYGMGAKKFQAQLKTFGVKLEEAECQRIINVYRETYPRIPEFWKRAQKILDSIIGNNADSFGRDDILSVDGKRGLLLPNGLYLKYPNLRKVSTMNRADRVDSGYSGFEYVYDTKKGKTTVPNRIYGGKVVENVCQALARIVIGEQMLMIAKKYKVVMTVHDAVACIAPEDEAERAKEYVELCMRLRPRWAAELPLNCEAGYGKSYGDC